MSNRSDILQMIVRVVEKNAPDSEVYLFGSQAIGNAESQSDWDVLILLNNAKVSFEFEKKIINEFYNLELDTGEVISPLIYPKRKWQADYSETPLFGNIKKEGFKLK